MPSLLISWTQPPALVESLQMAPTTARVIVDLMAAAISLLLKTMTNTAKNMGYISGLLALPIILILNLRTQATLLDIFITDCGSRCDQVLNTWPDIKWLIKSSSFV